MLDLGMTQKIRPHLDGSPHVDAPLGLGGPLELKRKGFPLCIKDYLDFLDSAATDLLSNFLRLTNIVLS